MKYLKVAQTVTLETIAPSQSGVSTSRLVCENNDHGLSSPHDPERALMIALQLKDYRGELWVDRRRVATPAFLAGEITLYDLRRDWRADLKTPFDCVNFHIPYSAFSHAHSDLRLDIESFRPRPGESICDRVVHGLGLAILPALESPEQACRLFTDSIEIALLAHLATRYGNGQCTSAPQRGGLTALQLRRAKEALASTVDGSVSISDVAIDCGLSPSHFAKAFKDCTGDPPHRWFQRRRIERSMDLMRTGAMSLSDVAVSCGFVDQSHFTRVFKSITGKTPSEWRKH